jgi:hypothetical protein
MFIVNIYSDLFILTPRLTAVRQIEVSEI